MCVGIDAYLHLHWYLQGLPENSQSESDILESGEKKQNIVSQLYEYMNQLNIQGMGLVEATERNPHVGHIVGELQPVNYSANIIY